MHDKTKQYTIYITEETHAAIRVASRRTGIKISWLVTEALKNHFVTPENIDQ